MKKIVIDGQVFAQRITGQYRYAEEILMEIDKLIQKNEFEILVPSYVDIERVIQSCLLLIPRHRQSMRMWNLRPN